MARDISAADLLKQQKARAQRVDHVYYRKSHPWRTRLTLFSWILPALGAIVAIVFTVSPWGDAVHLPGPVSTKHALFGHRCAECHEGGPGLWGAATDRKCLACHDGPLHHVNMVHPGGNTMKAIVEGKEVAAQTPRCASCHQEHRGHMRLADLADRHCTQCHMDLKTASGAPKYESGIVSFSRGHPEWAVLRKKEKDPTPIKLNHATHMQKVKWPAGTPKAGAKMSCIDCHAPDAGRAYMAPIAYEAHCKACHPIAISPQANIGSVALPHGKPDLAAAVVKTAFAEYLVKTNGKLPPRLVSNPNYKPPRPGQKAKEPEFLEVEEKRSAEDWRKENVANTLQPLFFPTAGKEAGTCLECHISEGKDEATALPKILDPKVPYIWLKHSKFSHNAHRVVECLACHTESEKSTKTEDVLLPGIQNCQACHWPSGGARSGCVECHIFHDKQATNFMGIRTLQELSKGLDLAPAKAEPPEPKEPGEASEETPPTPPAVPAKTPEKTVETKTEAPPEKKTESKTEAKTPEPPPTKSEEPAPAPKKELAAPVQDGATVLCPRCGRRWASKVKYCSYCGLNLAPAK